MSKSLDFRSVFVLSVLAVFLLAVMVFNLANPSKLTVSSASSPKQQSSQAAQYPIKLKASPVSHVVQMFDSLAVDAAVIKQFPNGTLCSRMGDTADASVEGIQMTFYLLRCNGVTGYVNAKWVSRN